MGCASSLGRHSHHKAMPLTEAHKYLVRETWEMIEPHKQMIGKKTFLRFFDMNPDFQNLFPEFKDLNYEELQKANALHGHAKRVMKAVENAVSSLDDVMSFSSYLEELGRRHKTRALKPGYLDAMQSALMDTLRNLLQSQWTEETAEAWNRLFRFISSTMVRGLQSQ